MILLPLVTRTGGVLLPINKIEGIHALIYSKKQYKAFEKYIFSIFHVQFALPKSPLKSTIILYLK